MHTKLNLPAAAFAGLVTTGLLALPISSAFAADDVAMKRQDDAPDLVLVADDEADDDLASNTGKTGGGDTNSRSRDTSGANSNDGTGSGHSAVSRDRDKSRGDRTRDWTKDGKGDKTRDHSGQPDQRPLAQRHPRLIGPRLRL